MIGAFRSVYRFKVSACIVEYVRQYCESKSVCCLSVVNLNITPNSHDNPTKNSMVLVGRMSVSIAPQLLRNPSFVLRLPGTCVLIRSQCN